MIKVEHLTKYCGEFLAVDDLSFEIGEGQVYGFLGPNGAGKSTTMNIMTGCLSATSGKVEIGGFDIFEDPDQAKRLIGYLPEQPPLYMNETPLEYLHFVGQAKGLRGQALEDQIQNVVDKVGIRPVTHKRISALSKGYKQRVGIAQALLGDPKVIILDEPTVGLDPLQIIEIRDLIKDLGKNHTVILSSHILSEVQAICEKILIIAHGKLVAFDRAENLENTLLSDSEITLLTGAKPEQVTKILAGVEGVGDYTQTPGEEGMLTVSIKTGDRDLYGLSSRVFAAFAKSGGTLAELRVKKATLEDIFIQLTETPKAAGAGKKEAEEK